MIDPVSGSSDASAAAAAMKKSTGLNKDDFMQLFVTQLQNQDPLNPQDSSEFIAQLAQLTQVEQAYNANSALTQLLTAFNSNNTLSAVSFIGKEVEAVGNSFVLKDGTQPTLAYRLDTMALNVKVEIRNVAGTVIRTITGGMTGAGEHSTVWDGKDDSGRAVNPGSYSYAVTGGLANGQSFSGTPIMRGTVDAVRFDSAAPILTIGNVEVPLADVTSVRGGS